MVENLLKVIHILEGLKQAEHGECWRCTGCYQQRSVTDSARNRSWSGDSKNYCLRFWTHNLGLKCIVEKFVPWLLLQEQKEHRVAVANDLIQTATNEQVFFKVMTGVEWQVYSYDPEMKAQSSQWTSSGSPSPRRVQQSCSNVKTTFTVFLDWEHVFHHKYTLPGQKVNKEYYLHVHQLRDAIWWKQTQGWATGDWQFHHNNTPTHASHSTQSFLKKHQITQVTRTPYNLELVPCDFWLFPKLKSPLKGKRFHTINDGAADGDFSKGLGRVFWAVEKNTGRSVWAPKVPTLKGTETSLSYVQCFLYLVSSSINVSTFHVTCWIPSGQTSWYRERNVQ